MKARCYNPNNKAYKNYGGRGIKICQEWLDDFNKFFEWAISSGFKRELTIERIDNDGDYCPQNCTWIPKNEQSRNRRSCHKITHNGKTLTASEWAREKGFERHSIVNAINKTPDNDAISYLEKRKMPYGRCLKKVPYKGITKTLREWCEIKKLNVRTVEYRIEKYGWPIEKALDTPAQAQRVITVGEESHTVREWSNITGIPYEKIRGWLYHNPQKLEEILKGAIGT